MDHQKTRADRRAERQAELEQQDSEHSASLVRVSLAQRLGVRPEDLTDEQLAAYDLEAAPRQDAAPARFPSAPDVRRQILEVIAAANGKYAKPFHKGKMAFVSLIGTESWSEYGGVVLQMAILDTLLSVEEKLGALLEAAERKTAG